MEISVNYMFQKLRTKVKVITFVRVMRIAILNLMYPLRNAYMKGLNISFLFRFSIML